MSRIAGRNARIYAALASGGTAEPVAFQAAWSLSAAVDTFDVTAFGDPNKVYVSGLPDASGDFSGFYDDQSSQTYQAAADGLPRKMYVYPSVLTNTQYWFGTVLFDFKVDGTVSGPTNVSATWKASTPIIKVG